MKAIILAGGRGVRLWPMSRGKKPKQFYEILSDKPMIYDVYQRLLKNYRIEDVYVAIQSQLAEYLKNIIPELNVSNIIIEPGKRDTGPAMAYVAGKIIDLGFGDEPLVFVPTDHYIADEDKFLRALVVGEKLIRKTGKMLDIGVVPRFASTALGYTHVGEKNCTLDGVEVYNFIGHKEKPDYQTAEEYIENGQYFWHANYIMWTAKKILEAYEMYCPQIACIINEIFRNKKNGNNLYMQLPSISIDYALIEKMKPAEVLIIKADFGWSDIGTWDVLHDRLNSMNKTDGNVTKGMVVYKDTHNCLIYANPHKIIATMGLQDMIVVDSGDALLICPKSRSSDVKKLVQMIEENNYKDFL